MLSLKRFKMMTESYGADLQRWPKEMRGDSEALLNVSAQARLLHAEAQTLDALIMAAGAQEQAMLWPPGEQASALARLRAGVAVRLASPTGRQSTDWFLRWIPSEKVHRGMIPMNRSWLGLTLGSGFAIVAGLLIGSLSAVAPPQHNVLAMLQTAPLAILEN
jgi:hypothetical protein